MDIKDQKNNENTEQEPNEIDYKALYEEEKQRKIELEEENEILRKSMDFFKNYKSNK